MPATPVTVADLSATTLDGAGVFDVLMRSVKAHLDAEFKLGRIKGPEYATVYLGSLEATLQTSLQFLVSQGKIAKELDLLDKQISLADKELAKADATIAQITAQADLATQQKTNLVAEALNIPKQGALVDAQKDLATQQGANAVLEGQVLTETKLKTIEEKNLLAQKKVTETAQTSSVGVDADSVVGKQKLLYAAQTAGFVSDKIQKGADLMIKSWNVRRTTDEATVADSTNKLDDTHVGAAVQALLDDMGA